MVFILGKKYCLTWNERSAQIQQNEVRCTKYEF